MNSNPIIIVAGEPYSIFSEIFFKTLIKYKLKKKIVLIGSKKLFESHMKYFGYNFKFKSITKQFNPKYLSKDKINIIDIKFHFDKIFDKITINSKSYIKKSFETALYVLKTQTVSGIINGPISKKKFLNKKYQGVTEYFAKKTKTNNFAMIIYNKLLSVSPLTTHLPLKKVSKKITKTYIINKIKVIDEFYLKYFNKKPKIAITGLNPHCESNHPFNEEIKIINPSVKYLKKIGINILGPFSADTIFLKKNRKKFDIIVGMYHDQVLTPIKTILEYKAINITAGLPFIRISPDHGPNEKMIGKNLSNPDSLIEAVKFLDK